MSARIKTAADVPSIFLFFSMLQFPVDEQKESNRSRSTIPWEPPLPVAMQVLRSGRLDGVVMNKDVG